MMADIRIACPHPDCRRTDMPLRPELVGQVLWCVCHTCRIVVEPVDGGYMARMVEEDGRYDDA